MDNCNARADGKCLRYRSDWEKLAFGAESFKEAFSLNIARIKEDVLGCQLVREQSFSTVTADGPANVGSQIPPVHHITAVSQLL